MREADPITQTLALWLLYGALVFIASSQIPKITETLKAHIQQPIPIRSVKL